MRADKEKSAPRLLVVDDEDTIRELLCGSLRFAGYEVTSAGSGAEALRVNMSARPDLVLLDVMMPGKSGWEVARALKQDPDTSNTKIVMVTAIGEKTNEITAPIYGADAHVDKPFEFEKLERVIGKLLG